MMSVVNVLLDTFPGLSLPSTVCLPCSATLSTEDLYRRICDLLPRNLPASTRVLVTTTSNKQITWSPDITIEELLDGSAGVSDVTSTVLPLRLSVPLCGGKGGFGSQLRAAGGRMSSKKKRQNAELASGSARNLDGRRLRTVTEAKNLATYLATKPEMDRKEKEERRKRWETVIEMAEQREADMRAGKTADGRRKGLSDEWIEEKDEVGENVKNAVQKAMMLIEDKESSGSGGSEGSGVSSEGENSDVEDVMELDDNEMLKLKAEAEAGDVDAIWVLKNQLKIPSQYLPPHKKPARRFAGFDEDDEDEEDVSSSDDDQTQSNHNRGVKGKEKVVDS